eukprot:3577210-Prymnesium_polylepis.1
MGAACAVLSVPSVSTFPPPPSRKATRHLRRYYMQGWPGKLELSTDMRLFAAWRDCSCILTAGRSVQESGLERLTRFRGTTCDER